jgi:hypothetical protein
MEEMEILKYLSDDTRANMRISYVLHRVPQASFACLLPISAYPDPGDVALARVEKIGKNTNLELTSGRRCSLHEGDLIAVVFGNRYATRQFEGYARVDGDCCDLLSMGGLCGLVESKHASVAEPTRLRLVGALGDPGGRPLKLGDFTVPVMARLAQQRPRIAVVCGTSMDSGKTHTVMSLILGLRREGHCVASIKLTGTASGSDKWSMLDAGASIALDFIDGGLPSTYLCTLNKLLDIYNLLIAYVSAHGVDWVVVEIADGLLQGETATLLQTPDFTASVDAWILATSDPLGAAGGAAVLRGWGIEPVAISGLISMSPLGIREVQAATDSPCLTARELQRGDLNARLLEVKSPAGARLKPARYGLERVRGA